MATTIVRTPMVDDDGSGTTGTVINNSWKTELYDQIDAALAALGGGGGWVGSVVGQIPFPATQAASANVNTLDDYEESTWLPTVTGGGGATGVTYSSQSGVAVKIGRLVFATGTLRLSSKGTITGDVQIGGLPYAAQNVNEGAAITITYFETASAVSALTAILAGPNVFSLRKLTSGGATSYQSVTATDLNPTSAFIFSLIYVTAT